MSRIGKAPIPIPDKVSVSLDGLSVTVKGPKGELSRVLPEGVNISQDGSQLVVSPNSDSRRSRERHGLSRTLVANMVDGGRTPVLSAEKLDALIVQGANNLCGTGGYFRWFTGVSMGTS